MAEDREHDLFVSYAHEMDPEWVRSFVKQLRNRVSALLPQPPNFYFDEQMEQGESVPNALLDAVGASRLLLVVLSPKYLASPWCRMELNAFLEEGSDAVAHRIFVVEAERIEREKWPAALRDKETIAFWQEDPNNKIPERLDPDLGEDYARMFKKRVGEVAHFIKNRLEAGEDEVPEYKGDVWIAESTDDLVDEWEELAAAVRQAGWRVLPSSPYPTHDPGAYTETVRRHLSNAKLFVQILGPTPGRRPAWGGAQFPILQATAARAAAQKRHVPWLRWRKCFAPQDTSEYATLLREGEVQESSLGDFKAEVNRYLTAPPPPMIPIKAPVAPLTEEFPVQVYVHSDEVDRSLADEIQQSLVTLDVDSMGTPRSRPGQSPQEIRLEQQQPVVDGCQGVILVYGIAPATWVGANFAMLRKAFATVRRRGTIGVLSGPPPDKPRMPIMSQVVLPLDCTDGLKATILADFVERVRRQALTESGGV